MRTQGSERTVNSKWRCRELFYIFFPVSNAPRETKENDVNGISAPQSAPERTASVVNSVCLLQFAIFLYI